MRETFPRSPFSTRFSGWEGETRLRVLSIAQGQHRRPAALVLALALAAILSCGGLVSCRVKAEQPALSQLLTDEILTDDILNGDSILAGGDLDGDGQEEALCTPALVYKLWPDGSLRQLNLRNTVLELLELDADAPLELTYLPGQQKISAQWLGDRRTFPLKELLDAGNVYDEIFAIGPMVMMKFVCKTTAPYGMPTTVSMSPIMIDGTGMCGGCRLTVGGETKFACVDGPDFDGQKVDWDLAVKRNQMYHDFEVHKHEEVCNLFKKEVK